MKKIITLTLFLITTLTINAQITTNIWGVTVGKSSKQRVKKMLKQKGYKYYEAQEPNSVRIVPRNGVSFGGFNWDNMSFIFYNNKIHYIRFTKDYFGSSIYNDYLFVKNKLDMKYSSYLSYEEDITVFYEDNNTIIMLFIREDNVLQMDYTNKYLEEKRTQFELNEL